jgi:hypothetical protein
MIQKANSWRGRNSKSMDESEIHNQAILEPDLVKVSDLISTEKEKKNGVHKPKQRRSRNK